MGYFVKNETVLHHFMSSRNYGSYSYYLATSSSSIGYYYFVFGFYLGCPFGSS